MTTVRRPIVSRPCGHAVRIAALFAMCCLTFSMEARAASPSPMAQGDADAVIACMSAAPANDDQRRCGERLFRECLTHITGTSSVALPLTCENRRGDAWNLVARRSYHAIEARLSDPDKHLLRTSQVQFELELRDLCAVAAALTPADRQLASASCASELLASRALILLRMETGKLKEMH